MPTNFEVRSEYSVLLDLWSYGQCMRRWRKTRVRFRKLAGNFEQYILISCCPLGSMQAGVVK